MKILIKSVILLSTILVSGCITPYYFMEQSYDIEVKEDKFNNSVSIAMGDICDTQSGLGTNICYLTYYKDNKKEIYYIRGSLYLDFAIRGTNLYKAVNVNAKELKIGIIPDSRLGWYNDYYEIKLSEEDVTKDIEIKLYGHEVSKVINISSKQTQKFFDRVEEYKITGK